MHTALLPIAIGGYCLGVPALFCMPSHIAMLWRNSMYLVYFIHYYTINQYVAIAFLIQYAPPLYLATRYYKNNVKTMMTGLFIAWSSVACMEFIGHSLFETANSRPDGVLNAILYSPYFTSNELVELSSLLVNR